MNWLICSRSQTGLYILGDQYSLLNKVFIVLREVISEFDGRLCCIAGFYL